MRVVVGQVDFLVHDFRGLAVFLEVVVRVAMGNELMFLGPFFGSPAPVGRREFPGRPRTKIQVFRNFATVWFCTVGTEGVLFGGEFPCVYGSEQINVVLLLSETTS